MTPEQIENLEYLINDPDWDVSQRNDAWELLKALREELEWAEKDRAQLQSNNDAWILRFNALAALRSPAPAAPVTGGNTRYYVVDKSYEDERGYFAVVLCDGIDGNVADVYGETPDEAIQMAREITSALNGTRMTLDLRLAAQTPPALTDALCVCGHAQSEHDDKGVCYANVGIVNGFGDNDIAGCECNEFKVPPALTEEMRALANALRILLASHDCLAPDGGAEIPEELSARFDIGLDDARQVVSAVAAVRGAGGEGV